MRNGPQRRKHIRRLSNFCSFLDTSARSPGHSINEARIPNKPTTRWDFLKQAPSPGRHAKHRTSVIHQAPNLTVLPPKQPFPGILRRRRGGEGRQMAPSSFPSQGCTRGSQRGFWGFLRSRSCAEPSPSHTALGARGTKLCANPKADSQHRPRPPQDTPKFTCSPPGPAVSQPVPMGTSQR